MGAAALHVKQTVFELETKEKQTRQEGGICVGKRKQKLSRPARFTLPVFYINSVWFVRALALVVLMYMQRCVTVRLFT